MLFIPSFFSLILRRFCLLGLILLLSGCSTTANNTDLLQLRQLKDQAFNGNVASQYQLGVYYTTHGDNSRWNWNMARGYGWFYDAAKSGHVDAQYMVGMGNLLGRGTSQNTKKAISWLTRSAEQGHGRSQYQLAQIYLNGRGVAMDVLWGRYWLEQAAQSNHPAAQFLLSALFRKGIGGSIHRPEALLWLTRAAQNGHQDAQKALPKLTRELSETEQQQAKKLDLQYKTEERTNLAKRPKVRYAQAVLSLKGFSVGADDGIWGEKTDKAVEEFLLKNKLPRDTAIDQLLLSLRGIN